MDPVFELQLQLPPLGSRRLLQHLHRQLKVAIIDGRLSAGLKLPSTRVLAARLGVSRNTAVAAYELLLGGGYVQSRAGAGYFVSSALPSPAPVPAPAPASARVASPALPARLIDTRLSPHARLLLAATPDSAPLPSSSSSPKEAQGFDFGVGLPDATQFRFDLWARLAARSVRALARNTCQRGDPQGQAALREAIAHHVSFTRAVACSAESIVVTQGAQQAFDLLARSLVTPGKTCVVVESPGYEPQQLAFAAAGARMVPVRVDAEGLRVPELPPEVRVISVSPSHQFPLGSVLSAERRAALIDFARLHRAVVIEDDYDGEFRFTGQPLDALQTLDRSDSVFYVGTFSKSMFASMRIGFIVAPRWALPALVAAKRGADQHSDVVLQETLAAFIAEGHLARHVRKMRGVYAARRQRLLGGLHQDFAPWLVPVPGAAGLHVAALAQPGVDPQAIARRAQRAQIRIAAFGADSRGRGGTRGPLLGPLSGLLFGYGAIDEDAIGPGLAQLRRLITP